MLINQMSLGTALKSAGCGPSSKSNRSQLTRGWSVRLWGGGAKSCYRPDHTLPRVSPPAVIVKGGSLPVTVPSKLPSGPHPGGSPPASREGEVFGYSSSHAPAGTYHRGGGLGYPLPPPPDHTPAAVRPNAVHLINSADTAANIVQSGLPRTFYQTTYFTRLRRSDPVIVLGAQTGTD